MYEDESFSRGNLHSLVVEYLKKKILLGEYMENCRVVEQDIARELNVSRAPVREAIRQLENRGLITSIPRKGNFVNSFTVEDIKEIFDIRMMFEDSAMEIIIKESKLSEEDFQKLTQMVDDMVGITKEDINEDVKLLKLNQKDLEFHQYLWKKSGSKRRAEILSDIHFQLEIAILYDTKVTADFEKTARDHYPIIESLKQGNLKNCKKAFREHIETIRLATLKHHEDDE